jgi:DNA repair ATPase RecN
MLALKTVLAEADATPLLVFDEVDANVGGEVGRAVGSELARLAKKHQVLCVTHSAPSGFTCAQSLCCDQIARRRVHNSQYSPARG